MKFKLVSILTAAVLFSCASGSAPAPTEVIPQVQIEDLGDDGRLVTKEGFLTDFPDWQSIGSFVSWTQEGNLIKVAITGSPEIRFQFLSPEVFRVRWDPTGNYETDNSYAVINRNLGQVTVKTSETPGEVTMDTGLLQVVLEKKTLKTKVLREGKILSQDTLPIQRTRTRIKVSKDIVDGDRFYGFGEKSGPLQKNGQMMKNWNTDAPGYKGTTDPLYSSIGFFVNAGLTRNYGIFFDNTYQSFYSVGAQTPDQLIFGATNGSVDYTFFAQKTLSSVVRSFSQYTGTMEMPPLWALGYQQSRYSYESQAEVLRVAKTFREKTIPADAIYLDIHFMNGFKSFTTQPVSFPDPKGMIQELKKLNFQVVSIIDPGISIDETYAPYATGKKADVFLKNKNGEDIQGSVWPGVCVFPDFGNPLARTWWGEQYSGLVDLGIKGFWNDMNEPSVFKSENKTLPWETLHQDFGNLARTAKVHNVYGLTMTSATKEALDKKRPLERNFVLSRAAYAGMQRYAAVWTGDNTSDWNHLKLNLSMVMNLGLSGLSFTGADVGGYSDSPSPELLVRWLQAGALIPLFRNHTANNTDPQEPWEFGPEAESAARDAIALRYKLMPYLYNLVWQNHIKGDPIVRPLFYEFPRDEKTYTIEDQFLLGPNLMAAPILEESARTRKVYFPNGAVWFDFESGREYRGGQSVEVDAPLNKIPLFVRGGAIVPTQIVEEYTHQIMINPPTINVWPGSDGWQVFYFDDGKTTAYKEGEYLEVETLYSNAPDLMQIDQKVLHRPGIFRPNYEYLMYRFHKVRQPKDVLLNGKRIPLKGDSFGVTDSDRTTAWYENDATLLIKVFNPDKDQTLEIQF